MITLGPHHNKPQVKDDFLLILINSNLYKYVPVVNVNYIEEHITSSGTEYWVMLK